MLLDFEGEPARSLSDRRRKRSPLTDVAGMLRSYSYAAWSGLFAWSRAHDASALERGPWATLWETSLASAFLSSYFADTQDASFIPADSAQLSTLLELLMIDKALYELQYELNNRPDWLPGTGRRAAPPAPLTCLLTRRLSRGHPARLCLGLSHHSISTGSGPASRDAPRHCIQSHRGHEGHEEHEAHAGTKSTIASTDKTGTTGTRHPPERAGTHDEACLRRALPTTRAGPNRRYAVAERRARAAGPRRR